MLAIPIAWTLNRTLNKGRKPESFVIELPHYRVPQVQLSFFRMYERSKQFAIRAGTVIFAMRINLWGGLYCPRSAEVESVIADDFGYAQTDDTDSLEYEESMHGKLTGKPLFNIPVALSIMFFSRSVYYAEQHCQSSAKSLIDVGSLLASSRLQELLGSLLCWPNK